MTGKKKNTLALDTKGFEQLVTKLEGLGGNVKVTVTKALENAGEKIGEDTAEAIQKPNLPAQGKYSTGDTEKSVIRKPKARWSGTEAEIGVGFDYSKPGAGGLLITGTPKMQPDYKLQKIYKQKAYMSKVQKMMTDIVTEEIKKKMEG